MSTILASRRARLAPRQKCSAKPNARWDGSGALVDVELVGTDPDLLVPVGRGVEQAEEVALGDRPAPHLHVVERGAAHVGDGRDVAEELLHRAGDHLRRLDQDAPLVGLLRHDLAGAGDEPAGRLVPRDQQDLRHRQLLVDGKGLTVPPCFGELGEEVVARVHGAVAQLLGEVVAELEDLTDAIGLLAVQRLVGHLDERVGPAAEPVEVLDGNAEHQRDHDHRQRGRHRVDEVHLDVGGDLVEQLLGDPLHLGFDRTDRLRRECVTGDLAQEAMPLAVGHDEVVGVQRAHRVEAAQLRPTRQAQLVGGRLPVVLHRRRRDVDVVGVPELLGVLGDRPHVLVLRDRPEPVALRPVHGRFPPEARVHVMRVRHEPARLEQPDVVVECGRHVVVPFANALEVGPHQPGAVDVVGLPALDEPGAVERVDGEVPLHDQRQARGHATRGLRGVSDTEGERGLGHRLQRLRPVVAHAGDRLGVLGRDRTLGRECIHRDAVVVELHRRARGEAVEHRLRAAVQALRADHRDPR